MKLQINGISLRARGPRASTRAGGRPPRCSAPCSAAAPAPAASSTTTTTADRHRRHPADRQRRHRPADLDRRRPPTRPGCHPAADDRRGAAGRGRAGARRRRSAVLAQGRHGDRHGPQDRRDPRAGQLAAGQRQRPDQRTRPRPARTGRSTSPTSPARRSRRSPWPARSRTAWSPRAPCSTSRRSSRSPTARSTTPRRTATRRCRSPTSCKVSSNIGADLIGAKLGANRFDYWVHRFGFGATDRRRPARRGGRHRPAGLQVLGLLDGQPAVRPGRVGHPDADGHRLRGDRQRGHPALAPRRRSRSAASRSPQPAGHRIISPPTAAELRQMLRGVLADGGTASGAAIPGYDLAGKTGTANVVDQRQVLEHRVRRLVHRDGPGQPPEAARSSSSSTSPRARSTAGRSPRRRSRRSSGGRCRTSASHRTERRHRGQVAR